MLKKEKVGSDKHMKKKFLFLQDMDNASPAIFFCFWKKNRGFAKKNSMKKVIFSSLDYRGILN